ncbi:MAG: aminoacyl-histidine dipeptidase [Oscillibacter sp.]|nr:aminoacyl-histidine dipeptidase [Oscillibacter sp.]
MAVLSHLEPKEVFAYFEQLCSVPHGSGNTKQISDLCVRFARELGLRCRQDEVNNVVIWKDGTPGYENAAPIILQGHIDMVCTKTETCTKDMAVEGLDLDTDGEWVWAKETTLGGDNCIAVAMILALLADKTLSHPPLEAVFTVDEETGMGGAFALDCSDLKGRQLLNLDSEEEGVFTVSCAGGARLDCFLAGSREPLAGETGYTVTLEGLLGGHSGGEIHMGRASANQVMGRVLYTAMEKIPGLRLADIRGGKFDNVICPYNQAKAAVPADKAPEFEALIRELDAVLKNEYTGCDDGIALRCEQTALSAALSQETTERMLHVLLALPQGVQAMNVDFPGLVQTSLNLGVMGMEEDGLHFAVSVRSCIASQKEMLMQKVRSIVEFGGGAVSVRSAYPGWQYVRESTMRERLLETYREVCGKEGVIDATHGGLECGLFIEKMPGLDAVSLGPELHNAHSVRERLSVPSTERMYRLVREFLSRSK